jgi:hypothetical protein
MDGVAVLTRARAAGLTVVADGDRLAVKGPKSVAAVARQVLAAKAAVLAVLRPASGDGVVGRDGIRRPPLAAYHQLGALLIEGGYPALVLDSRTVGPGENDWRQWVRTADVDAVAAATGLLERAAHGALQEAG